MNSYVINLCDSEFNPENKLIHYISAERRERLKYYHFDIDKKISLYGELTVRMALAKFLNCSPKEFTFEKNNYGKPYISNISNLFFNMSHTRNAILCSVSDIGEVGVDIERIDNCFPQYMNRLYNIEEIRYLDTFLYEDRKKEYCKIWTRKEAFGKKYGFGIGQNLSEINTLIPQNDNKYFTWQEHSYICSTYCDVKEKNDKDIITEQNLNEYFSVW